MPIYAVSIISPAKIKMEVFVVAEVIAMIAERYRVRCGLLPNKRRTAEKWRYALVPPIPKPYLQCSVYLYPSEQLAKDGKSFGGSGFVVGVPVPEHEGWANLYVVTNKHVVDKGGLFIRFNRKNGKPYIKKTTPDEWTDHNKKYDVSAYSLDMEGRVLEHAVVPVNNFITREAIEDWDIGPGDDAFLVGRLITPWGQQRNVPAVRFGNISMMADPNELAIGYNNVPQEAFFVECRSLSGFSGSPVFCSTTRTYEWDGKMPTALQGRKRYTDNLHMELLPPQGTFGPWLLGIDWGHLPLWKPVYPQKDFNYPKPKHWVEQNTGIACVLPAWHVLDLIMKDEEFVKERKKDKENLDRRKRDSAVLDYERPDQPLTKAGFDADTA